jgi:hypothetical protein
MSIDPTRPPPGWWQTPDPPEPRKRAPEPSSAATPREPVRIPVIWLAELFTPTTFSSLIKGVSELIARTPSRQDDTRSRWRVLVESITSDRRTGRYSGWEQLPTVRPEGSQLRDDEVADQVPAGIRYILLEVRTLTPTVTVLTAQFGLDDDRARGLENILIQKPPDLVEGYAEKYILIQESTNTTEADIKKWQRDLREGASGWLANQFPGSFARLAPGQLPTIDLLLTGQLRPWEPNPDSDRAAWAEVLDLGGLRGYWQCTTVPSLRLQEIISVDWFNPDQRHCLVLAAPKQELTAEREAAFPDAYSSSIDAGRALCSILQGEIEFVAAVGELLARWSLTALIRELEEELEKQIARIRDSADQTSREGSAQKLAATQQQLLQTGINNQIVVKDIIRYAEADGWAYDVLDFTKVAPPPSRWDFLPGPPTPPGLAYTKASSGASLADSLRTGQITGGQRISQLETDLHEILNTSASLASASESIRLQGDVYGLTVIATRLQGNVYRLTIVATIVAIIAALAAILTPLLS